MPTKRVSSAPLPPELERDLADVQRKVESHGQGYFGNSAHKGAGQRANLKGGHLHAKNSHGNSEKSHKILDKRKANIGGPGNRKNKHK